MKQQVIFKKGQKVIITEGNNASDFNTNKPWSIMGAYSIENWHEKEFEIEGTVKLFSFSHNKRVYGAYLLKCQGVNVGYIYNTGIKVIEGYKQSKKIKKKEFTKSDLRTGMKVQFDVGSMGYVLLNTSRGDIIASDGVGEYKTWMSFDDLGEDLTDREGSKKIIRVFGMSNNNIDALTSKGELIWEITNSSPEYTMKELVEKIGHKFKIKG